MMNNTVHDVACHFQKLFFAMCRLNTFPWQTLETELQTSPSVILDILKRTCLHAVCRKHPPSVKYRRLFIAELIKRHESTALEPSDELYEALADVVGAEEDTVCYKTYFLPSGEPVSLEENVAMISGGTTGLVTWEAGLYLAEWALENPQFFNKRTVLELGSGAGLTGIAISSACKPMKYIFSDCHQSVLQRLNKNIKHNGLTEQDDTVTSVCVEELDWKNMKKEDLKRMEADIVIAADVVYDPDLIGSLVSLLDKLLNCKPEQRRPEVYISSTVRNPETYSYFKNELEKAGLRHLIVTNPIMQVFPYDRTSSIEIIKVHRCDKKLFLK